MTEFPQPGVPTDGPEIVARTINQSSGTLEELTEQQWSVIRNKPREVLQYVAPPWRRELAEEWNVKRIPNFIPTDSTNNRNDFSDHKIDIANEQPPNSDSEPK